jgi:N utilization substance protein B
MTGQDARQILKQFHEAQDMTGVDEAHLETLLLGVSSGSEGLDEELQPFLDRPMQQVDLMEQVVLRIGAFELLNCPESPFRVVVDECVDLAHRFGSEQGHAYVNAVLDKAARAWRPAETGDAVTS